MRSALVAREVEMNTNEVLEVFREAGAVLEGHFILTSGLRSPIFLQQRCFQAPPI